MSLAEGSKATTLFKEFASHVKKTFKAPKLVAYFRSANQEMDKLFGWALDEFHWKAEKLRRKEEYGTYSIFQGFRISHHVR